MINVRPQKKLNGRAGGLSMRENQKMHDSAIRAKGLIGCPEARPATKNQYQADRKIQTAYSPGCYRARQGL